MKKLKAKLNKQGGFTLIEMLIVVAIIAILIAISIPIISATLERAREAVDDANERSAISLAYTYYMTNGMGENSDFTKGVQRFYVINPETHEGRLVDGSVTGNVTADNFSYGRAPKVAKIRTIALVWG